MRLLINIVALAAGLNDLNNNANNPKVGLIM
jgi:hypothetical protein